MMKRSASPYAIPTIKQGRVLLKNKSALNPDSTRLKSPSQLWLELLQQNGVTSQKCTSRKPCSQLNGADRIFESIPTRHLRSLSASTFMSHKSKSRPSILKSQEDMYDEIMELKKNYASLNNENLLLKTKLRWLEDENLKMSRQIQELLNNIKVDDLVFSKGKQKDSTPLGNGLRQKVLRLEQILREKDNTLSKLQGDIQSTNIKEMKIQVETFYQEILRLQNLVAANEQVSPKSVVKNELVFQIIECNKLLKEENESLRGQIEDLHVKNTDRLKHQEEIACKCEKLEAAVDQLKERECKLQKDADKMKKIICKAKEERCKFKKTFEKKEKEILVLQAELELLHHNLDNACNGPKLRDLSGHNFQKKNLNKKNLEQKRQSPEKTIELTKSIEKEKNSHKIRDKSLERSPNIKKREGNQNETNKEVVDINRIRLSCAARTIQREWRKFKEKEEAIVLVQSSVKAHLARSKYLQGLEQHVNKQQINETAEIDEALTSIQSAIRGHLARSDLLEKFSKNTDSSIECFALSKCLTDYDDDKDVISSK